jgi:glutaredoxin
MNVLRPSERVSFAKRDRVSREGYSARSGRLADLKKLGYMTTPVIVIDGSVIVGFDVEKIHRALHS